MNHLYGVKYIEKQRSSGYKSTVYAIAEIVDNSVDAGATKIDLIFSEKENYSGQKKRDLLDKIYMVDNGAGMTVDKLNGCLTFAEGSGSSDKRIGAFGVGLPNSSISVCRKVEVYSRQNNGDFYYVCLDLDDQKNRSEPGYDSAIIKNPDHSDLKINDDTRTIVIWSNLDRLEVARAATLFERCKKLIGRIYRYKIDEGLKINLIETHQSDNKIKNVLKVLPYDPLFIMEKENYITKKIWEAATSDYDLKGAKPELAHLPIFTPKFHYSTFIEGRMQNENKALFQKFDSFWDVKYSITFGGREYEWRIKASFANAGISNPGIRNGGMTSIGKILGDKANGTAHFPSGNIFFLRAGREIDYGNFGLYTITDPKNRFWTIEIHFDSNLDELMGLSNDKQSVKFKPITEDAINQVIDYDDDIPLGLKRELLWKQMTQKITKARTEMMKYLAGYARQHQLLEASYLTTEITGGTKPRIPQIDSYVSTNFPKASNTWNESQKKEVINFLKEKYMYLSLESISEQVEQFSNGYTKTIVLYAPNETGKLFELTEKQGKQITLINTNHKFYKNIIEPLKLEPSLKIFAISIELLISSFAIEMENLVLDDQNRYEQPLNKLLLMLSSRLDDFLTSSGLEITSAKIEEAIIESLIVEE